MPLQELSPYLTRRHDCQTNGDLCVLVGVPHARTFVCDRWDQMRNGDAASANSPAGCSENKSKSDDDGRVVTRFNAFLFNKPYEDVSAEGEGDVAGYELGDTWVCASAGWTDPC